MSASNAQLPRTGKAYVLGVVVLGTTVIVQATGTLLTSDLGYVWMLLAALTFFSGPFSIRVPSVHATISVSESFVFASALLFGPAPATITVALDGLIISLWGRHRNTYRTLFNIAEPAVSVWVASQLFYTLAGIEPLAHEPIALVRLVLPLLALTTVYFFLNGLLTAGAVYFDRGVPPIDYFRTNLPHLSLNFFGSISLAALVLFIQSTDNVALAAAGVIIPLLVMSYVSQKTATARVEDANRHLTELNKLYLSTVETLAMAIDAKDQVTHGHIRRVQIQAVELARALGVHEGKDLKAIEAAALLHDLGKLAVPEHILNKPGKLTPAEYEQMKEHANIGADILSRISFPYPVTPIVRYHHENWDGTGYPSGLSGEAIPIGARILSVVDCFDALTSDRPYRRALSDREAMDILMERRGNMYDPAVVDMFIDVHGRLPRELFADNSHANELRGAVEGAPIAPMEEPVDGPAEALDPIEALGDRVAAAFKGLVPSPVCVLYVYEASADAIVAAHVSTRAHAAVKGMRVRLGEKLSGWVAANGRGVMNSDPALDLGEELAMASGARLLSTLSVPLESEGRPVGVLSLYSPAAQAFSDEHLALVRLAAGEIARQVKALNGDGMSAAASVEPSRQQRLISGAFADARPKGRARSTGRPQEGSTPVEPITVQPDDRPAAHANADSAPPGAVPEEAPRRSRR